MDPDRSLPTHHPFVAADKAIWRPRFAFPVRTVPVTGIPEAVNL